MGHERQPAPPPAWCSGRAPISIHAGLALPRTSQPAWPSPAHELFDEAFDQFCNRAELPEFDYIGLRHLGWISDEDTPSSWICAA